MRESYNQTLKSKFSKWLTTIRSATDITQEEMADRLLISCRSYSDLDNGYSCCSGLTLTLFLTRVCPSPLAFLQELSLAFDEIDEK